MRKALIAAVVALCATALTVSFCSPAVASRLTMRPGFRLSANPPRQASGPTPVLLMHMDGTGTTFTDSSGSGHTFTAGAQANQTADQFKWSKSFDAPYGAGVAWVLANHTSDFDFGTSDFTIDFWYRPRSVGYAHMYLFDMVAWNGYGGVRTKLYAGKFYMEGSTNGTSWNLTGVAFGNAPSADAWYHLAIVRSGATITGYVNGVPGASPFNVGSAALANSTIGFRVGGIPDYPYLANGYIDEVRVLKGTAAWTANFSANLPSAPY